MECFSVESVQRGVALDIVVNHNIDGIIPGALHMYSTVTLAAK